MGENELKTVRGKWEELWQEFVKWIILEYGHDERVEGQ
jgi:hypothetical protein